MATFNLPSAKQRTFLDPNVLPKRTGVDYRARSDEAWREIKETLAVVRQERKRVMAVSLRIQNGETWLRENVESPERIEAYALLNELRNEAVAIGINIRCLNRVIWNNCCTLYATLHHTDREAWLAEHDVDFDALSPEGIWQAVCPGQDAPGSWPEDPSEKYIDRKLTYTGWQSRENSADAARGGDGSGDSDVRPIQALGNVGDMAAGRWR